MFLKTVLGFSNLLTLQELNEVSVSVDAPVFEELLRVIWERVVQPRFQQHIATRPAKIQNYYDILQVRVYK